MGELVTKVPLILALLVVLVLGIPACSFLGGDQSNIPETAMQGIDSKSIKILGNFKLSDWAQGVPSSAYFTIFEAYLSGSGEKEIRVFYDDGNQTTYIGALSDQFGIPELKTSLVDLGKERCIIGWVSPQINGKLLYIHFERLEADRSLWMNAQKESSIENNLFIVPITGDDVLLWNSITMAAIQTKESLQRGFDGTGSYYELERAFSSSLDTSNYYIPISIQP